MQTSDLLHVNLSYTKLGGVEGVLHRHHAADQQSGLNSKFLILFEPGPDTDPRLQFLGFDPQTKVGAARRSVRNTVRAPSDVAVYHALHAMTYFADLDQARRRIAFLHGYFPGVKRAILTKSRWFDGILCVSEPLHAEVRQWLPHFAPERIAYIPYAIDPPHEPATAQPWGNRPLIVGFSGRLEQEQKRVDRLPGLLRKLDALNVDYQLELLGDGGERAWLEAQCAGNKRVIFHGRRSGSDYWRILSRWDVILFVSDFEGTPISMIEAMNRGVIPVYPRINTGGDAYARETAGPLLYEPGDLDGAAQAIAWLAERSSDEIQALRQRAQAQVARHDAANYHRVFGTFVNQIQTAPRISQARWSVRPFPFDALSFGAIARAAELVRKPWRMFRS